MSQTSDNSRANGSRPPHLINQTLQISEGKTNMARQEVVHCH